MYSKRWKRYVPLFALMLIGVISQAQARGNANAVEAIWGINPPLAQDLNPAPDIVEVELVASVGRVKLGKSQWTEVWTYNGSTPGPTIEANVGDTVIVHFRNQLPQETTVHWHGVESPATMDGSHIAQKPVPPGGYFRYEFKVLRPSLFWYHPHVRSNEQVEKGLYGALLVHDPAADQALGLPETEHLLLLDDILVDADGAIAAPFPSEPLANADTQLNGREGNVLLVNGRVGTAPHIRRDQPLRLRIVNTANARFMRVSIPGHTLYRIGGDGGLLETPIAIEPVAMIEDPHNPGSFMSDPDPSKGLLLTPGERADIVFTPRGKKIPIEWHDFPRGRHATFRKPEGSIGVGHDHMDGRLPPETLLTLKLTGPPGEGDYMPPAQLRDIAPVDTAQAKSLISLFGHTPPDAGGDVTFFVQMKNGMPLPFEKVTPQDAPSLDVGDVAIWEVHNMTGGDHNFHLHGFTFQLIETEFIDSVTPGNNRITPAPYLEDKDTIFLPKRPGAAGSSRTIIRLAVRIDDTGREGQVAAYGKEPGADLSGGWLFHCHVLEHARRGMMSFLQVNYSQSP